VGVRRVHALNNPGLAFLLLHDGSPESQEALELGGEIARLAHARATLLGSAGAGEGSRAAILQARERLGRGLAGLESRWSPAPLAEAVAEETGRRHYDLAVQAAPRRNVAALAESILQAGDLHLLLVPRAAPVPTRALVCVAVGEPGKEDVLFASRFLRHLGAEATLFTVLRHDGAEARDRAERFLAAGLKTLSLLGVRGSTAIARGVVVDEVLAALRRGGHDLLILGAPLADRGGKLQLDGVVAELLGGIGDLPVLIVRPRQVDPWRAGTEVRR
jgi:sulfate transport system ATP-binding protein